MPKLKTRKTAAKRFKISGTGKLIRRKAFNNHMFLHKGGSQKRRLGNDAVVEGAFHKRMIIMLGEM